MAKAKLPSPPQARMIASLWSDPRPLSIMVWGPNGEAPWNAPTTLALVRNGWVVKHGKEFQANDRVYQFHLLTQAGVEALAQYLLKNPAP